MRQRIAKIISLAGVREAMGQVVWKWYGSTPKTKTASWALSVPTATTPQSLEGRWKATSNTVYFSDGTTRTQNFTGGVEFSGNRSVTECRIAGMPAGTAHINRELGPGQFEQTIIENSGAPNTVGMHSRIDFRIENGTLFTTGYPAPPNQATSRYVVKVESPGYGIPLQRLRAPDQFSATPMGVLTALPTQLSSYPARSAPPERSCRRP